MSGNKVRTLSFPNSPSNTAWAGEDLSTKRNHGVFLVGRELFLASTANAPTAILLNSPKQGQAARFINFGFTKAVLGGTVAQHGALVADDNGALIAGSDSSIQAMEAGVNADLIDVLIGSGSGGTPGPPPSQSTWENVAAEGQINATGGNYQKTTIGASLVTVSFVNSLGANDAKTIVLWVIDPNQNLRIDAQQDPEGAFSPPSTEYTVAFEFRGVWSYVR